MNQESTSILPTVLRIHQPFFGNQTILLKETLVEINGLKSIVTESRNYSILVLPLVRFIKDPKCQGLGFL